MTHSFAPNATQVRVERASSEQAARRADCDSHEEPACGGSVPTVELTVEGELEQESEGEDDQHEDAVD